MHATALSWALLWCFWYHSDQNRCLHEAYALVAEAHSSMKNNMQSNYKVIK